MATCPFTGLFFGLASAYIGQIGTRGDRGMSEDDKRTESMRVRLSASQMERLVTLSKRMGMPPATLGALGVNRFLDEEWSRIAAMDHHYHGKSLITTEDGELVYSSDGSPLLKGDSCA